VWGGQVVEALELPPALGEEGLLQELVAVEALAWQLPAM
jgi:hypothetical protein